MLNNLSTTKPQDLPVQDGDIWTKHFENLYKEIPPNQLNDNYNLNNQNLQTYEDRIKNNQNPLDFPITREELPNKPKSQHSGRNAETQHTCASDSCAQIIQPCSPDLWSQGLVTPIHKSGDKLDPNNFRGICVSSNLGKLFSGILNNRIVNFLNEHNVLSPSQIGFLPNYRTTDHIYTLHTLINKHVKQTKI